MDIDQKRNCFFSVLLRNNNGLSSISSDNDVYGTFDNSVSSSSVHPQNQDQSMCNPNGLNQQTPYPTANYPNHLMDSHHHNQLEIFMQLDIHHQFLQAIFNLHLYHGINMTLLIFRMDRIKQIMRHMYYPPYYPNLLAQQYHS